VTESSSGCGTIPADSLVGSTISHYKILEKLGEGGMGVVCKAEDAEVNLAVKQKGIPSVFLADPRRVTSINLPSP